ncbi:CPBP family intramembrane glutamic endopeptidase [Natronomonas sp. LN261]|jgi:membrane protease YdiL (CAAX protease family)|uniref:CPBP family intramembrane glutamic endopeptidase n=1 Tax=Natronomonas sp. LN261 TaxID=2750669 RepID=UPI0015EE607E|nr:CPBP family intramembrane glutamic endopeptidase [Natronomonas sp. LN261]
MSTRSRILDPLLAVGVALGLASLAYGGGNVAALGVVSALGALGVELTPRQGFVLSVVTLQLVFFTGVSLLYLRYRGMSLADIGVRIPTLEGWIVLGVGFVSMLVLWLVGSIASFVIGQRFGIERESQAIMEIAQQDPLIFLMLGVLSLLVIGPTEELLFRGIIQTRLRETFGVGAGVTLATALFAVIHIAGFGSVGAGVLGVSVLFFVGFVLALSYEYTGNLVVVALMHGLFNATQAALGYVGVRFGDPDAMAMVIEAAIL